MSVGSVHWKKPSTFETKEEPVLEKQAWKSSRALRECVHSIRNAREVRRNEIHSVSDRRSLEKNFGCDKKKKNPVLEKQKFEN
jgi:hypothetical protein